METQTEEPTAKKLKPGQNRRHQRGIHGLLTPKLVRKYAQKGMTLTEIGDLFDCTGANIRHAIEVDDELKAAWRKGHSELLNELTGRLKLRALEGSDICLLFLLKTRFQFVEEQFKLSHREIDIPSVHIYLPENDRDTKQIEYSDISEKQSSEMITDEST